MDPLVILAILCGVFALLAAGAFWSTRRASRRAEERLEQINLLEVERGRLEQQLSDEQSLLDKSEQARKSAIDAGEKLQLEIRQIEAAKSGVEQNLKDVRERLAERDDLQKLFGDQFKAMSSESLATQEKRFIDRARETLKPLSEKIDRIDREWATTAGAFRQQITSLANETRTLSTALTRPQARGQWGEMQVERALELSGLTKGIHYETQAPDEKGGRTDFIVHMPHNRDIILDSKVSLVAIIDAQDAADEAEKSTHLDRHARMMQAHADSLAAKEYWNLLPDSADFVVMVVPEFALPPAVERRPNLIDRSLARNVVIATHSTLVALLKTVAMGWQERKIAEEATQIGLLGRDLHDRLETFADHFAKMGVDLQRTLDHYNKGVGSLESSVLVQARRFLDLGIQTTKRLPELKDIDDGVRQFKRLSVPKEGNGINGEGTEDPSTDQEPLPLI